MKTSISHFHIPQVKESLELYVISPMRLQDKQTHNFSSSFWLCNFENTYRRSSILFQLKSNFWHCDLFTVSRTDVEYKD